MRYPGDEDEDQQDELDAQHAQHAQHAQDDKTLLDELFGDAADADDVVGALDEPSVPPLPVAPEEPVVLAEPGLPEPAGMRRMPAWQGLMWARSSLRPAAAPGCREVGLTTAGFVIFMIVDSIMMYAPFRTHSSTNLLPQAVTLALLAFGLGALMIWSIRGACRPVGVGMMLGWVFMTLISAGYFTGLNP